jgi:hypothetical protein
MAGQGCRAFADVTRASSARDNLIPVVMALAANSDPSIASRNAERKCAIGQ